jgi:hypothetical protein
MLFCERASGRLPMERFSLTAANLEIFSKFSKKFGWYFQKAVPLQRKTSQNIESS